MKNYGKLVPIVLIFLLALSFYKLYDNSAKVNQKYSNNLAIARDYAENHVTKMAINYYRLALADNKTSEVYAEVADYYKNEGEIRAWINWCEEYINEFPTDVNAYERMLEAYITDRQYGQAFMIVNTADKRNVHSDYIDSLSKSIWYEYNIEFATYDEVGEFTGDYCAVNNGGYWGLVDSTGKMKVRSGYQAVGAFLNGVAPVVTEKGEAYYVDNTDSKVKVAATEYAEYGIFTNSFVAVVKTNGKYTYLTSDLLPGFGEYDYASAMNGGVAAVKNGNTWTLINESGNPITGDTYADVKVDEKGLALRNNRIFAKNSSGKYVMLDAAGARVGNLEFEDAYTFTTTDPTAVKIGGKWQFVKQDGTLLSDTKYDDARAYSSGLAAVSIDGKWGYIDIDGQIAIENKFDGATNFNSKGSAFVKQGDSWSMIKLYRLSK